MFNNKKITEEGKTDTESLGKCVILNDFSGTSKQYDY